MTPVIRVDLTLDGETHAIEYASPGAVLDDPFLTALLDDREDTSAVVWVGALRLGGEVGRRDELVALLLSHASLILRTEVARREAVQP